jgi:hypothetical protein
VLRNLLGPSPTDPVKIIADFHWGVQNIEAAPDGSRFLIQGKTAPPADSRMYVIKAYDATGRFVGDLPLQVPTNASAGCQRFDPTSKLLVVDADLEGRKHLFEIPGLRFLGPVSFDVRGISQLGRLAVVVDHTDHHIDLTDETGNVFVERIIERIDHLNVPFSPDLDGRYLLWGDRYRLVNVADLVRIREQLTEVGLGW